MPIQQERWRPKPVIQSFRCLAVTSAGRLPQGVLPGSSYAKRRLSSGWCCSRRFQSPGGLAWLGQLKVSGAGVQLAQTLAGLLVGRGIGRHPGAEALAEPQMGVVQLEQAYLRVQ